MRREWLNVAVSGRSAIAASASVSDRLRPNSSLGRPPGERQVALMCRCFEMAPHVRRPRSSIAVLLPPVIRALVGRFEPNAFIRRFALHCCRCALKLDADNPRRRIFLRELFHLLHVVLRPSFAMVFRSFAIFIP